MSGQGAAPRPGDVVDHYRLEYVVGLGGMGMVFAATDLRLQRQVALKVMLAQGVDSPTYLARFEQEASVLARLDSPHVVSIYDHGEQHGVPYLVTQLASGGDLGALLREHGALPPAQAFQVCAQVADALAAAHAVGVVHRDVKPANVLLRDRRAHRLHVFLCDFGVAHAGATGSTGLTTAGAVAGTWNYLAPERAAGDSGGPAADVYAVGCLLVECLTGRPPYAGADVEVAMAHLQRPVPSLPGQDPLTLGVNAVLGRAMAKDPTARHGSAAELRDDLRALGAGLTPAGPVAAPLVLARRRRHRRALAGVAAAVLAGTTGIGATLALAGGGDDAGARTTAGSPTGGTSADPDAPAGRAGEVVTGDLDGDGRGDLGLLGYDATPSLLRSDGAGFGAPRALTQQGARVVAGDVDGDGLLDLVHASGEPPNYSVVVERASGSSTTSLVSTMNLGADYDASVLTGDVDGDGYDDVGIVTRGEDRLGITVSLADGTGALGRSTRWWVTEELAGSDDRTSLAVGDLTGDGRVDLVLVRHDDDAMRARLLTSTGSSFEPEGEPVDVDPDVYPYGSWTAGDLDGDGRDEAVYATRGPLVLAWSWEDGVLVARTLAEGGLDDDYGSEAGLSDLDGDGDDDVVLLTEESGLRVLLAGPDGLELQPGPGRVVADDRQGGGALGRVHQNGP